MIIDMLEAVSEMLNGAEFDKVKVQCARVILIKIIEGMKRNDKPVIVSYNYEIRNQEEVKITPPKREKIQPQQDQFAIVPNDDGSIKDIIGMDDEGKIELDGVLYTKKEAIGKKFQTGKVIG